jgi:hypothetical protein
VVAPEEIRVLVESIWGVGPDAERALAVIFCESTFNASAKNPSSSASGLFQLMAPWTRNPGSGQQVWGWAYSLSGEKLSAAAGLGFTQEQARWDAYANARVAYEIWSKAGNSWSAWNASRSCWG